MMSKTKKATKSREHQQLLLFISLFFLGGSDFMTTMGTLLHFAHYCLIRVRFGPKGCSEFNNIYLVGSRFHFVDHALPILEYFLLV
jgi:hypothetical protein